jgi:hypothetical protein
MRQEITKILKLWKKYKKNIENENKKILQEIKEFNEDMEKKFNEEISRYEYKLKEENKIRQEYYNLPWYKRIFKTKPYFPYSRPPMPPELMLQRIEKPNLEDFIKYILDNY